MTLQIGDKAPDFALQSDEDQTVKLSDFRGRRVLYCSFIPKRTLPAARRRLVVFATVSR